MLNVGTAAMPTLIIVEWFNDIDLFVNFGVFYF